MSREGILDNQQPSRWMTGEGPASDIVVSSRVRLARNLKARPFPRRMDSETAQKVLAEVGSAVKFLNDLDEDGDTEKHSFNIFRLDEISVLERQILAEKHLISPQHARSEQHGGVILRNDQAVSVMVNEEDHLRIQCLFSGLSLTECWELAGRVEDALARKVSFAFDDQRGYLTTCPTNTGTGLRASVMMHLPGLVMSGLAGRVLGTLTKVGVAVRGLYGEGSEAKGNLFQVSNQITLGQSEEDIIQNLTSVARQLIERERSVRERLYQERKNRLEDQVCRAYGLLTNARVISSEEAIRLLSQVRLGIDLNILPHVRPQLFNELLIATRPGSLQQIAGGSLDAEQRDVRRAALLRQRLSPSA